MEDIDLSGLPITIVHIDQPFRGTFDGNGKKIYNYRKEDKSGFKGLFGWIYGYQSHAEIKNLTLVNPIMILEKDISGGLLADDVTGDAAVVGCHVVNGYIESATQSGDTTGGEVAGLVAWNKGTIVDCTVTGTIIGHSAGGLVSNNKGTIRNCSASVEVLANQSAGGLATYNYGIVERCSTTGKVESVSTLEWLSIGGLVGSNHCYGEGGIISDCNSSSDITLNGKGGGGLVGLSYGGMITYSYATGSVTGTSASYIGGLVGTIVTSTYNPYMGIIEYCYATGDVSGDNRVGGLVGESGSSIVRNCYATGAVSAKNRVGGLMGVNYFYPYNGFGTAIIDKCYSTGQVTGNKKTGGLVGGYWPEPQIVTNSFWDTETSGRTWSNGGTGKTTAEMQAKSTFTNAGWDFSTPIWTIEDNNYPRLWWEKKILYVPAEYPTIQAAIDAAVNGDTVIIAPGTYTGDGNRDIDFLGKAITVRGVEPNDPNVVAATVIDCEKSGRGFYFRNGEEDDSILSGLTIANGYVWASTNSHGGGIYCKGSNPSIRNCVIILNLAEADEWARGGGIYCEDSNSIIVNCTFMYNNAKGHRSGGGAIYLNRGKPKIINSEFIDNKGNWAGAIYCNYSNVTIAYCDIRHNNGPGAGGGIHCSNGDADINNCLLSQNSTINGSGGGLHCFREARVTFSNCEITMNWCKHGGGGIGFFDSNSTVKNCTIAGNVCSGLYGGGIHCAQGFFNVTNCIIWSNRNSTGGGEAAQISYTQDTGKQIDYCCIEGLTDNLNGTGNIGLGPCFVNPDVNDYHLLPDSPCINAGDPNFIAGPNDTDMDGESRVMLGRVDMGADEFNPFKVEFDVVEKRRIGRTVFEYECEVILENISRFAVKNIQLTLAEVSENMTIIEPNVTFGDIEVGPGELATSIDTCTFSVDRSQAIDPAKIIWHSTCEMADTGQTTEQTASSLFSLGAEDIPGDLVVDGWVDFADLAKLAERWLWKGREGSIPEDIVEDGAVNLADFAELAEKWKK